MIGELIQGKVVYSSTSIYVYIGAVFEITLYIYVFA